MKKYIKTTFQEFINESIKYDDKEIIDFITTNSYFDYEGKDDDTLKFATRKNGSVSSETASNLDIAEANRIKKEILDNFKGIVVKLEVVDEWVLLDVEEFKEPVEEFKYVFKKDNNGSGFSESFNSIDELIDKYGTWIEVDWDEIKNKMESINSFPDSNFNGSYSSQRVLIKKAGEDGNKWGYNFYITKIKYIK